MDRINDKQMHNTEIRKNFFRDADLYLRKLDPAGKKPIVIAGVERNISLYKEITKYNGNIIAEVTGSYEKSSIPEAAKKVWPEVKKYFGQERIKKLNELAEAEGRQGAAYGVEQCWKMAKEGRGKTLLVEINYSFQAKVDSSGYELTEAVDPGSHDGMEDAVDELIELVISKGGDVCFYENGALEKYNHIALIARY
jgi:stalled ribosome rescue protein Dom34